MKSTTIKNYPITQALSNAELLKVTGGEDKEKEIAAPERSHLQDHTIRN